MQQDREDGAKNMVILWWGMKMHVLSTAWLQHCHQGMLSSLRPA